MAPLALAQRLRRNVTSFGDATVLTRVALVMGAMPLVLRLPIPRAVCWLERASRLLSVGVPDRVARVVKYVTGLGSLHTWSFQDNCLARNLTLFTLLNRRNAPIDVVFGVQRLATDDGGVALGRRHVWLERDGAPLLETEAVADYLVSVRFRNGAVTDARRGQAAAVVDGDWAATLSGGIASLVMALASAARSKTVAVLLGPAAFGLLGQQSTLAVLLMYLASFGSGGGTTRFLSEALAAGHHERARRVVRTSIGILATASLVLVVVLGVLATPLARLAFGPDAPRAWIWWLLPAVPLTAASTLAYAVLRGHRLAVRHNTVQILAAVLGFAIVVSLALTRAPLVVFAFPAAMAAAQAIALLPAAWRPTRALLACAAPRSSADDDKADATLTRDILSYGAANVVMAAGSAISTIIVGRLVLAHGGAVVAGEFYALSIAAEALLAFALGGYQAHYYPAFCAAAPADASRVFARLLRTATMFAVLLLGTASVIAPFAVPLLLSDRFTAVIPLVRTVALGAYFRVIGTMLGLPLLARGHLLLITLLHLSWAAALVFTVAWMGADRAHTWAIAYAATAGGYVLIVGGAMLGVLRLRIDRATVVLITGGAVLLAALAR